MNIILDGAPIPAPVSTIAGALTAARAIADRHGRIVTDVFTDGHPAPGSLLENPPASDGGVTRLEIRTADPRRFVCDSLIDASDALLAVKADQSTAAEHIQSGELADLAGPLGRVLETWGNVSALVQQAGRLSGVDPATVSVRRDAQVVAGSVLIAALSERLQTIRSALVEQDWGTLSDELAYELDDEADAWAGFVRSMAEQVENGS